MSKLAQLLTDFRASLNDKRATGLVSTGVPGVTFFWDEDHIERAPLIYNTGLVIIGQGWKIGYLGGRRFDYGAKTCLVVGVPAPFECEAHGSLEEPLLGIRVDIDLPQLHRLVAKLLASKRLADHGPRLGVEGVSLEGPLRSTVERLLESLRDPMDAEVLGPAALDEIIYRVLLSDAGSVLYSLTQHHTAYANIARALDRMHADYREQLTVEDLAAESAMSTSSFHRAFKSVTGESPLQYLKKIRLLKAKGLLVFKGARVDEAAYDVGYTSPSQFSREFKRYFKVPPSEASTLPYSAAI